LKKKELLLLIILSFLLLVLSLSLGLVKKAQIYLTEALGQPANIVVDAAIDQGQINPLWQALAQGGEEKNPFTSVINETAALKPKYIRIDHIYDYYDVVKRRNGTSGLTISTIIMM